MVMEYYSAIIFKLLYDQKKLAKCRRCTLTIPALRRWRLKAQKFKDVLG